MMFTRFARSAPSAALALALVTGGSLGVAAPAFAKEKAPAAPKANYSKGFIAVYTGVNALLSAATPDVAGAAAQVPALIAAIETEDDRNAAGNMLLMIGQKNSDVTLQAQGLDMMIASGKVEGDRMGVVLSSAAQLASNANDFAKSRDLMQKAITAGYANADAEAFIAETYFSEGKYSEGLSYLTSVIDARKAAGQPVKEDWIRRGLAIAYKNELKAEAGKYSLMYVDGYPSATSWGDAVAILLNTGGYQNPEILDLLRLARRASAVRDGRTYLEYLDAADYRRLPAEVVAVIDEGVGKGLLKASDPFVSDTRKQAASRVSVDEKDLPNLVRAANAGGATYASIMAAADTLLSMGKAAEAEGLYVKAMASAGVNTPLVLTRLGIAQADQGKYADAQTTFAKVEGARQAIASLWSVYARQKAVPAPAAQ